MAPGRGRPRGARPGRGRDLRRGRPGADLTGQVRRRGGLFWHRDFRLLWFGDTISQTGTAVTSVAMPLVALLVLHASTFTVGALQALVWLPWLLFGLPAGAWVDRLRHRPVLVICDLVSFLLLFSVPVAAWFGVLSTTQLLLVALLAGSAGVFFSVAYSPYLPSLLGPEDLAEANAKLQGSAAAAQFAGPSLGGVLTQALGAVTGLLADALSFLVSAACLLRIGVTEPPRPARAERTSLRTEIVEGLRFIVRDPYLRVITAYSGVANFADMIMNAVLVVFLVRTVGLSAGLTGVLVAVSGLGGLFGAIVSGWVGRRFGSARGVLVCELIAAPFGLLMPLTSPGPGVLFAVIGGIVPVAGIAAAGVAVSTFRQTYVPARLRGRTTATARLIGFGSMPLGALLGAFLGQTYGPRTAIWVAVIGLVGCVGILLLGPLRRKRDFPAEPAEEG